MSKKKITEVNAVAAIMDGIFGQVDERWPQIWQPVQESLDAAGIPAPRPEFIKFNYTLAVIAVNFRAAFDLFPRHQAERIFTTFQKILKSQLGEEQGFHAVQNAIMKYIEAYNTGVLKIRNPLQDVAMLLYYKIGMQNTEQRVVDEHYYVPEPKLVEYLKNSLMMFAGKWEMLTKRFDVVAPHGRAPQDGGGLDQT